LSEKVKWNYDADWVASCNCDWGCPCNFNQKPTQGFCNGVYAGKITTGKCGPTSLEGVSFVWATKWPGAIHEGGGTNKIWIDEKASTDQRKALDQILRGKLEGKPWGVFSHTIDSWLETGFVPVEVKLDGSNSFYRAGTEAQAVLAPMTNPVTGEEAHAKIVLPDGLVCNELDATATKSFAIFTEGLKFAAPGKYGFYTKVSHGN
jgi:hypothetical protein